MSESTESSLLPSTNAADIEIALANSEPDWSALDTETLVSRFREIVEWPPPALMEEILKRKEEAVAPLIAFAEQADVANILTYYAVELLIILGDPSALPAIARFFHDSDADFAESIELSLPAMGPAVVPFLMPFVADRSLDWYQRSMAIVIMQEVIGGDDSQRRELIGTIHNELAAYVAEADTVPTLSDKAKTEYYDAVSMLIADLADLAAQNSLPLIQQAFDADLVDEMYVGRDVLTKPMTLNLRKHVPNKWMEWYVEQYEHRNDPPPPRPDPSMWRDRYIDRGPQKPYIAPPKPGRNDACWCGSGKKYKKCHLGQPDDKFAGV